MEMVDALQQLPFAPVGTQPRNAGNVDATSTIGDSNAAALFQQTLMERLDSPRYSELAPSSDPQDYPNVPPEKAAEIKEAAQQLESLILYQLLKQMWATIPEGSLFENGPGSEMYREMWLEQLAGQATKQDSILGVSDMVQRQLLDLADRTVEASELVPELEQQLFSVKRDQQANKYGYISGTSPLD